MGAPSEETFWQILAGFASTVTAAALGILGIQYKRYRKDRSTLYELKRKMEEVDAIRSETDNGRKALTGLRHVEDRMNTLASSVEEIVERQDLLEKNQNEMLVQLAQIGTDVRWIRDSWIADRGHP